MTLESPTDTVIYRSKLNAKINRNFEVFTSTNVLSLGGCVAGASGGQGRQGLHVMAQPAEAFERLASLKFERTFAKLLLIAFVCGFAERITHDAIASVLKRFSKQATDQPAQAEKAN